MAVIYIVLVLVILASAIYTVHSTKLIRASLALCLGGSSLAVLFFLLGAPYAGSVQLSVGAGLLSILFIVAISLTDSTRGGRYEG
ncbi:MAG: NADH-quinone oxidoreductase subunit J [Anaerolineae bacterium]